MSTKVAVRKADAEKVLAAVKTQFRPWLETMEFGPHGECTIEGDHSHPVSEANQPMLVKDYSWDGVHNSAPYAIVWESGSPYEWALIAGHGGIEEEFGFNVKAVEFPKTVHTEPIVSFILGIYEGY